MAAREPRGEPVEESTPTAERAQEREREWYQALARAVRTLSSPSLSHAHCRSVAAAFVAVTGGCRHARPVGDAIGGLRARAPSIRLSQYSRRLLELFKAESGLIKLSRFDEAKNVRRMIDKIQPREIEAHDAWFEDQLQQRRNTLKANHESATKQNDEVETTFELGHTTCAASRRDRLLPSVSKSFGEE